MWTVGEALKLTGMTRQKLKYLDRTGILALDPFNTRCGAGYSDREVLEAMVVARLRGKRIRLSDVRRVLVRLRKEGMPTSGYIVLDVMHTSEADPGAAPKVAGFSVQTNAAVICHHLKDSAGPTLVVEIPTVPKKRYNSLEGKRPVAPGAPSRKVRTQ